MNTYLLVICKKLVDEIERLELELAVRKSFLDIVQKEIDSRNSDKKRQRNISEAQGE
jgi:hypothetical protein